MMRKILVSQFLTLDGIMESPEKWNSKYINDAEVVSEILEDFSASDLILFGRTTYDFFAERWPVRTGAMADYLNNSPKLVVSKTLQHAEWNNSIVIGDSAIEEIKKRKEQSGKNMLVIGSYGLVQTLIYKNLVDEYKLYLHPLTLGRGKRLFEEGAIKQNLKLIVAKQFASGVISATYQPEK